MTSSNVARVIAGCSVAMNDYNDYVGRSQWNDPYFNGSIDELRIYNSALSSAQIQADYIAGADLLTGTPGTLSSIAMISSLPNKATFEIWATWNGGNAWQPMISFGCSKEGEDLQGTGTNYLLVTPYSGNNTLRAVFKCNDTDGESPSLNSTTLPTGVESYIVVTYDSDLGIARLYRNGVRVDTKTVINPLSALNDINNWLGRAQWGDYYFNGSYNELRIWSGVMACTFPSLADYAPQLPHLQYSPFDIEVRFLSVSATVWPLDVGASKCTKAFHSCTNGCPH